MLGSRANSTAGCGRELRCWKFFESNFGSLDIELWCPWDAEIHGPLPWRIWTECWEKTTRAKRFSYGSVSSHGQCFLILLFWLVAMNIIRGFETSTSAAPTFQSLYRRVEVQLWTVVLQMSDRYLQGAKTDDLNSESFKESEDIPHNNSKHSLRPNFFFKRPTERWTSHLRLCGSPWSGRGAGRILKLL